MALTAYLPLCELLKSLPLAHQIHQSLHNFQTTSNVEELAVISTLLKYTVPDVFQQLPEETQDVVALTFRSAVGLGNLIGRIDMISKLKADTVGDLIRLLNIHTRLLEKVLSPKIVLVSCKNALSVRELDKLLYKGKCFGVLREVDMKFNNVHIPTVLVSLVNYTTFLSHELVLLYGKVDIGLINSLIWSLMSLNPHLPAMFFDTFFQKHSVQYLQESVAKMKIFERKRILVKFLDYASTRYLKDSSKLDSISAIYILGSQYFSTSVCDELMCETIISHYNHALNHVLSLMLKSGLEPSASNSLVLKLLANWGNLGRLEEEPIVRQEFRTHLLLCVCNQLSSHSAQDLLKDSAFVSAISNRLTSLSNRVKSLGIYFADSLSRIAGTDPIFNMSGEVLEVSFTTASISTSDIQLDIEEAWEILQAPTIIEPSEDVDNIGRALEPVKINDADESNMSEDEDDPTLANNKPVPAPIYIRDILQYLAVDSKSHSAYEKQRMALQTAPTLLRQKLAFGSEVSFYAEELLTNITALTNQYEESDFESLKLNAMIAVVVSYPSVATHLCQLLLTGDYSLQQRMCLLSSLSLACRELRGYQDESVQKSFERTSFPSKMLPEGLHNQYLAMDASTYGYSRIENTIQNQLMSEASEEAQDVIAGGKILRVSSALRKKSKPQQDVVISKDSLNHFNKVVGKQFFFPLVAVWYESQGIDIGPYTPVLVAHFIRTLSIILHTAYPAAVDIQDMAREYINLVTPVIQRISTNELQVIESIVTGVMLVCEIFDETYLVVNFDTHLTILEHTISSWWESLIDDRVKSLCAGFLLRISKIRTSMNRTIMDQMNLGLI